MNNIYIYKVKRLALTTLALIVSILTAAAQEVILGTVTDDMFKEPIIGANVVLVNSQNRNVKGTITDMDGNFSLQVPEDAKGLTLQVSYIGMKTFRVKYAGQKRVDVVLSDDDKKQLKEVVVSGSRRDGMGLSKLEQTGSIESIHLSEIVETTPISTVEDALQGQIAGLDITMGGDPGAKNTMQIRGTNTLNGDSQPLIVVDGVPYDVDTDEFEFATANEEDFGALLNIAPSNIESIDVLKDASATAIYGGKGSNGVIVINTKKGTTGKTQFSFSTKWTIKQEPSSIPLLNGTQYTALMQDALWNTANAKGVTSASAEMDQLFNADEINYNPNYKYYDEYNCNTDWLETVKQNAIISDNNFSMSGGGEKARYRFSLGYYDEQGTTRGTGMSRLSTQLKVTYNFSDRLRVHTDFNFTNTKKDGNVLDNVRSVAQSKMPNLSPYWIDDATGLPTNRYFVNEDDYQGTFNGKVNYNPLAMAELGFNKTNLREEKMTITVDYDFPFHLRFNGWVSLNMRTNKNKKFLPQEATGVLWNSSFANNATDATSDSYSLQSELKFIYANTFADLHNLTATAVMRTSQSQSTSITNTTYGNASPNLSDPVTGSTVSSFGSGDSERRSVSFIGQAVYTFDNRYVLKGTINYEGNSAMGKNNRFGAYPAFGFAWNINREHFITDEMKKWFTEGKLRLGMGWTGKAPSGAADYYGAYESLGLYVDNSAIYPTRIQLDNLKWETTREWDFGIDLRLFDKLNITFDYYDKVTTDLLLKNTYIPYTVGSKDSKVAWINSGKLSNKGFELRFDYDVFKNKVWSIRVNANCSRNINKVEELPSTYVQENYTFGNGNYAKRIELGQPVGAFYGYHYLGVYQNTEDTYARDVDGNIMYDYQGKAITMRNGAERVYPGDAKYEDVNGDGVINEKDIVYLGNANPKLIFGGGFTVKWKDLTLTTLFYGRLGQKVINQARMNLENMYGKSNQSTAVLNRWRSEGDQTEIPRALYGMGYNYLGSDRFVEDATYVRLKTLTLSYNVPKKLLQKLNMGLSRCTVFATGYDLFTFTGYSGQDPEVGMPSATNLVMDKSTTPITKRYVFGLTVNF